MSLFDLIFGDDREKYSADRDRFAATRDDYAPRDHAPGLLNRIPVEVRDLPPAAPESAPSPWSDRIKVSGLLGDLGDIAGDLARKSASAQKIAVSQQFNPEQLFRASDVFAQVYQQLIRRGLI